jgi:uncharacterized protein YbjT (DUF2867 family)
MHPSEFRVRALVRPSYAGLKLKNLQDCGAEIVTGDLLDKQSLAKALEGCWGVYGMTDFWKDPHHPEKEFQQGQNLMDAIRETDSVKSIVYSSLECTSELTQGKIAVPCFDEKAKVARYAKQFNLPMTEIRLAFYYENLTSWFKPKRYGADETFIFDFPMADKRLDLTPVCDIGAAVVEIFRKPEKYLGKAISLAGDSLTGKEIAQTFEKVTGQKAVYQPLTIEQFLQSGGENAEILAPLFRFLQLPEIAGKLRSVEETKKITRSIRTFKEWLHENQHLMMAPSK